MFLEKLVYFVVVERIFCGSVFRSLEEPVSFANWMTTNNFLALFPLLRIQPRFLQFESKFVFYFFYKHKENYELKLQIITLGGDTGPPASTFNR